MKRTLRTRFINWLEARLTLRRTDSNSKARLRYVGCVLLFLLVIPVYGLVMALQGLVEFSKDTGRDIKYEAKRYWTHKPVAPR